MKKFEDIATLDLVGEAVRKEPQPPTSLQFNWIDGHAIRQSFFTFPVTDDSLSVPLPGRVAEGESSPVVGSEEMLRHWVLSRYLYLGGMLGVVALSILAGFFSGMFWIKARVALTVLFLVFSGIGIFAESHRGRDDHLIS